MTVASDPAGRRSIQVEVVVPGTPEEVWEAIATGPGVSSWFCPTEVEGRVGGVVKCRAPHHEVPKMEEVGRVTRFDPPRRFATESPFGPDAPALAAEWTIEPQAGGRCLVRVEHHLFAETDAWDGQLENIEMGWPAWFTVLGLYLAHFRRRPSAAVQTLVPVGGSASEAWDALSRALDCGGLSSGGGLDFERPGAPRLRGVVEKTVSEPWPYTVFRLDRPAPGLAIAAAFAMGGQGMAHLTIFLFGGDAASLAARDEPRWREWMEQVLG